MFKDSASRRDFYFSRRAITWLAEHQPDDLAWLRRVKGSDGDGQTLIQFTAAVRKAMTKATHDRVAAHQDSYANVVNKPAKKPSAERQALDLLAEQAGDRG